MLSSQCRSSTNLTGLSLADARGHFCILGRALEKARACRAEEDRAKALGSLAPHLAARQIHEALAAAMAIGDEVARAMALGSLAPHLSVEQIGGALAALRLGSDPEVGEHIPDWE